MSGVRDFVTNQRIRPEDLSRASAALFFTRWVTHFCAPGFSLLAGVGIGLYMRRGRNPGEATRFLVTRGLWLVFLDLKMPKVGGIEVLTRYLAKELGPRGIAVNTVAPGAIATDFSGGAVRDNPEFNKAVASATALGRVGLPEDIGPIAVAGSTVYYASIARQLERLKEKIETGV